MEYGGCSQHGAATRRGPPPCGGGVWWLWWEIIGDRRHDNTRISF